MSTEMIVTDSITIDAQPARVWDTLVNPSLTRKYMFDCEAVSDWKPGSRLEWRGATDGKVYVVGNVIDIEKEKVLRYTVFDPNGGMKDLPSNYLSVTYSLAAEGGRTVLTVTQGDFAKVENGQKRYDETVNGWGMVMAKIKEVAEEK